MILHDQLMISDWCWQLWGTDSRMLCFLHQGKQKQREMSELPFGRLPHSWQCPLQLHSAVCRGPGLEQPRRGHQSRSTRLALKKSQFTVCVETEGLCMYLVQMMALTVQPLEEQTWQNLGRRHSHLFCWTVSRLVYKSSEIKSKWKTKISSIYSIILKISFITTLNNTKTQKRDKYWSCAMDW